jgi:excinuclease ABC subunit A
VPWLTVRGARHNNLKNIDVAFPLGRFTCVTGVSGSGKSSLVNDIVYRALARDLNRATTLEPGPHTAIDGREHLDKVIAIDQSPIGRTPRSNPATYIKVFDEIRALFAKLPDARLRGYRPGRFSFNVPAQRMGGRCEACQGNGANRIEMDFLADVWVACPVCEGRRFGRETLQIRYHGRSVADVLAMEVRDALALFENLPRIRGMLQTLHDVGLDYIQLGQPSTTLSGGEAQRVKLARELVKKQTGRTLYLLDEPTTGLHFDDIRRLLAVLHGFVDAGNTVIVIEHNLDVLKTADWIIDLGPEGGEQGGLIVAEGTPEDVAACEASYTGAALREVLGPDQGQVQGAKWRMQNADTSAPGERSSFATGHSEFADEVRVVGARQHNLKDLSVSFPRDQITVCTGVSGSGKTSFAIDTVFTEGYRRYVESLSAYARQFLGQLAKPRVDHVEGLSPAICIEQRSAGKSPRSTVGTVTEIYDYMRVLWARLGTRYCPRCQLPIGTQTADQIVDQILALPAGAPIIILAPVSLGDGESYAGLFNRLKGSGYTRVRIDGQVRLTAEATTIDARRKHRVEVVVDRTVVRPRSRARLGESVEHALALGNGVMTLLVEEVERVEEDRHEGDVAAGGSPAEQNRERERAAEEHHCSRAVAQGSAAGSGSPAEEDRLETGPTRKAAASPRVGPVTKTPARELILSAKLVCTSCGTSFEELGPHHLSFNSQLGWCETCEGLGVQRGAPAAAIIHRPSRTLFDGALAGWYHIDKRSPLGRLLLALCEHLGVAPDSPLSDWTLPQKRALLFGTGRAAGPSPGGSATDDWIDGSPAYPGLRFQWRGLFPAIDHASRNSWSFRYKLRNVVTEVPCVTCRGGRLRPDAAAVRLGDHAGKTIVEVCEMPLSQAATFFADLRLDERQRQIAGELLKEIRDRLQFLIDVGLRYLALHRAAPTLSGGEAQRIRLASQIGSGLSGVLYVLDEPTIGMHPRDTRRLIAALAKLRDLGNTLLVVEHDRDVIRHADRLLDFGPRAGNAGGRIVAQGTPAELVSGDVGRWGGGDVAADEDHCSRAVAQDTAAAGGWPADESLTRAYLAGAAAIPIPSNRRPVSGDLPCLAVRGARQHNLKNIDVPIPLGRFVCVTGVSGSGKSSLVNDILWPALANKLQRANLPVGDHDGIEIRPCATALEQWPLPAGEPPAATLGGTGVSPVSASRPVRGPAATAASSLAVAIDKVINVDQSPIGNTPSSNPATYTGVFDWIRELFARLPESKLRGYNANRFSFNRPGGRCEVCEGQGQRCIEMHFMPDVWVECETCRGQRYNPETLEVRFKGKSIADVLEMRVGDALRLFENVPKVRRMLQTLADVGLDYVQLGQPAPTLSGGEAQRVKLAAELGKPDTGQTFYLLDEPTTGLHFDDIRKLLAVIHRLADLGNTVLVVEHNLDVLKCADWIIDLGPEAGDEGGYIVAMGTPEQIVRANTEYRIENTDAEPDGRGSIVRGLAVARAREERREAGGQKSRSTSGQVAVFPILYSVFFSHTAAALRPILDAGPYQERLPYDPRAHAAQVIDAERRGFGDVGKDVRMPWQVDGRRWHLEQRRSREDEPRKWEPAALEYVLELVHQAGRFEPTNWANRASVEVTAPGAKAWFLHALTGGEWLLELCFLVPPGTFKWLELDAQLGLKTLDEREDLETYGDWSRVDVRPRSIGMDAVVIYVHDRAEIDTAGFRKFIRQAARAYLTAMQNGA